MKHSNLFLCGINDLIIPEPLNILIDSANRHNKFPNVRD